DIGRLRSTNHRLNSLGGAAIAQKINDEHIPVASLGLKTNYQVLRFLASLGSENCARIQHLDLSETDIDDALVATLPLISPNLKSLSLNGCLRITDDGLAPISNFDQLKSLDLSDCRLITDD